MSSEHKKLVFDILKKPTYNLGRAIRWSGVISEIENELDKRKNIRSYKKKLLLLNGFYLVNLVALWQVFIEDLVEYGCDLIERNIDSNPEKLLHKISLDRSKAALKRFNTPDRGRIDQIFLDCFGVENITECWKNEYGTFVTEYDVLVSVLK
ncbi:MAG: hypothetical protein ABF491_03730, partial [Acetobacter sp.]|uniref:hypothetical protein n=1 Tax=Acetobacter sp. TaxID=440 RepID=UPI0039E8B471